MSDFVDQLFSDPAPASDGAGTVTAPAFAPATPQVSQSSALQQPAGFQQSQQPAPAEDLSSPDAWALPPAQGEQQYAAPEVPPAQQSGQEAPVAPPVPDTAAAGLPQGLQTYVETYGAENVQALADMAFGLLGIGEIPQGVTPQAHFLDQIYQFDQRAYSQLVSEIVRSHEADFVGRFRDRVLQEAGLPTSQEELQQLRDYARYGSQYVADEESRAFLNQIPQNLQATFQRQSQPYREYLVSQVSGGYMRPEVAVEMLQRAENDFMRDQREQQAQKQHEQQQQQQIEIQAHQNANRALAEQRDRIIEQKAKADNLHPEIVRDIYARAGQELEEFANAAMYNYAKTKEEYEIGLAAINGYQALVEAQKTGSQLAVKQAMNSLRILAEQRYAHHLQVRRHRAQSAPPPQSASQQQPAPTRQLQSDAPRPYALPNGQNLVEALFQ